MRRGLTLVGAAALTIARGALADPPATPPAPTVAPPISPPAPPISPPAPPVATAPPPPAPLPEFISTKRAVDPITLAEKKEGTYLTGLPLVNADPDTGIGFGARAYVYADGRRDDPFFAHTPYRQRAYAQAFFTTNGLEYHTVDYDAPYVADSPYRLRGTFIYERNTAQNYFGRGADTLSDLRLPSSVSPGPFSSFSDYDAAARAIQPDGTTFAKYNQYVFTRPRLRASVERDLFGGVVRPLFGIVASNVSVRTYDGDLVRAHGPNGDVDAPSARTKLGEDCAAGRVLGCNGGWDNGVKLGVAFDTRDFEPDPTSGVFLDTSAELFSKAFGSAYDYGRVTITPRGYWSPAPQAVRLVIAGRAMYSIQFGDVPFYSMNNLAFDDGDWEGLGGLRTLRGFKQDRYVGRIAALANLEVRWTFARFAVVRQRFHLMVVPFLDMGRVFDDVKDTSFAHWKRSQGAGLRIAWNLATIICVDFGAGSEGTGLYVNFGHPF